MNEALQITGLLLLSSVKFLFAPATVAMAGYNLWQTILITTLGGWMGVLIFYFFGRVVMELFLRKKPEETETEKPKTIFTKKNKLIVRIKSKFGLIGLALITPPLISIPVGSILVARYFGAEKKAVIVLMGVVVFWSVTLSIVFTQIKQLF